MIVIYNGQRTIYNGQLTMDNGQFTMDNRLTVNKLSIVNCPLSIAK